MKKLICETGVYTIVLPHYIDMQELRMNLLRDMGNQLGYTHIEYKKLDDYSYIPFRDYTVVITIDYKDWDEYNNYLTLVEYCKTLKQKSERLIIIAQLPEASTFNLLQYGLELLDENNLYRIKPRSFSIPKSIYALSDAVISLDNIKWSEKEEGKPSYKEYRILKSYDELVFPFGKQIIESQII